MHETPQRTIKNDWEEKPFEWEFSFYVKQVEGKMQLNWSYY